MIDLGPPPLVFPKPAIIRSAGDLTRHDRRAIERRFGVRFDDPEEAFLPGMFPAAALFAREQKGAAYLGGINNYSSASSITATNFDISLAPPDCYLVVSVHGNGTSERNVGNVAFGGSGGVEHVDCGTQYRVCGIWGHPRPAGSTCTIAVFFSGSISRGQGIGVWALVGLESTIHTDTALDLSASSGVLSDTINVSDTGMIIAASSYESAGAPPSWSGVGLDENSSGGSVTFSKASAFDLSSETGRTISSNASGSNSFSTLAAASWV